MWSSGKQEMSPAHLSWFLCMMGIMVGELACPMSGTLVCQKIRHVEGTAMLDIPTS